MAGSILAGTVGFAAAESAGFPVAGVAVYWAGFAGFLAIWRGGFCAAVQRTQPRG
jgi:hypothetical protein